ncbi:MAG: NUDIX hydrolase [Candidatus Thorarchaeota archaeon]|nr:NUDIX hydrolase [Candidatus Thorarchaeota archaeon]
MQSKRFWSALFQARAALNDLAESEIAALKRRYGVPVRRSFRADFLEFECNLVRQSTCKGRNHDITCFIEAADGYVVIQKHAYANTGIYRAPSGGANVGEDLETAAKREMHEETGLDIELVRFVLDVTLDIRCQDGAIHWRSLVFLARKVSGEMTPLDTHEVYDIAVMTHDQLLNEVNPLMEATGWGGFRYRAFLTREFFKSLDRHKRLLNEEPNKD